MSKSVGIFAPKYPPDVGGASVYFEQVTDELASTVWTPTIFAPENSDAPEREQLDNGGEVLRVFPRGSLAGLFNVAQCYRRLSRSHFDVLHVHPHFPQWRFYRYIAARSNVPIVYDCRDRTFKPKHVRNGAQYLSAAEHIDALLRGLGVERHRIQRSPVIVNVPDDLPDVNLLGDGPHVAYVGDLTEKKGIKLAIETFEYLEHTLHVFGDGPLSEWVKRQDVAYYGAVPHRTALSAIKSADVLVLPSETEGKPRVVLEAKALGTPIVATRVGSIPDIVGESDELVSRRATSIARGVHRALERNPSPTNPTTTRTLSGAVTQAYNDAMDRTTNTMHTVPD